MPDIPKSSGETPDFHPNRPIPEAPLDSPEASDQAADPSQAAINDAMEPPEGTTTGVNTSLDAVPASDGTTKDRPLLPPDDLPGPDSENFGGITGHWDVFGNISVTETRYSGDDGIESILSATDTTGVDITAPALRGGYTLEGNDPSGVLCRVVARDDQGRPTRVFGQSEEQTLDGPGDMGNTLVAETTFSYNKQGLLATVVDTYEIETGVTSITHQNVFNEAGVRTGCVMSRLIDVDPATNEKTDTIDLVSAYEMSPDRSWREITYRGYRDGLIPFQVRAGAGTQPFSEEGTLCVAPPILPSQLPYHIASHPEVTTLVAVDQHGAPDTAQTITLPTWIPKTAAHKVAAQSAPLEQLAAVPDFPETHGVRILDTDEAFRIACSTQRKSDVVNFINRIGDKETVVLQQDMRFSPSLREDIAFRVSRTGEQLFGPLTAIQKLGIVAALHPAFSIDIAKGDRNDPLVQAIHAEKRDRLLGLLKTNLHEMASSVRLLDRSLSEDVRRCCVYLLG